MKRRLPWVVSAATVLLSLLLLVLGVADRRVPGATALSSAVTFALCALAMGGVGALLMVRRPDNRVGYVVAAVGLLFPFDLLGQLYASYAVVVRPGSLPGPAWVLLCGVLYAPILFLLCGLLPQIFPTGHLLSPRWRWPVWAGVVFAVTAAISNALLPDPTGIGGGRSLVSPLLAPTGVQPVLRAANGLSALFLLASVAGGVAAVVVRYRRASQDERQQLKVLVLPFLLLPAPFIAYNFSHPLAQVLFSLLVPLLPVSIGVAVLRYRLYDIDRILSRTVSYALVTGILLGGYVAMVALIQIVLPSRSSLAVAASTLAVAAAFRPIRRRVQHAVDRRFNRSKYDAEAIVESFARRLREQVDFEVTCSLVVDTVRAAVEPSGLSLWLAT